MLRQDPELEPPSLVGRVPVARPAPDAPHEPPTPELDVAYARSGDVRIAYQVVGDGPLDLVLVHGWVCSFQPGWESTKIAGFYRRLASLGRLILFDKRGTGLSDRVSPERLPDLETRMDDVRAVLDAVQSAARRRPRHLRGRRDVRAVRRNPPRANARAGAPRSCSPTSSAPPPERPSSATAPGRTC
jgi:hypothetical protein